MPVGLWGSIWEKIKIRRSSFSLGDGEEAASMSPMMTTVGRYGIKQ